MKRLYLIVFLALFFTSISLVAQPGDPGDTNPTVPISGIEILLVAGGILGIKKLYSRNKKSN